MRIKACLPIGASAWFFIDKPSDWEKWSKKKQLEYFLENCDTEAGLCHQCSNEIESDIEVIEPVKLKWLEFLETI